MATNGGSKTVSSTTGNSANTGPSERPKGIQFPVELKLRDYFAAHALSEIIRHWRTDPEHGGRETEFSAEDYAHTVAIDAFKIADAMLRAREK